METTENEIEVNNIHAYAKNCVGCSKHHKDIMIAFDTKNINHGVKDLFLTTEQAVRLSRSLTEALKLNKQLNQKV